MRRIAVITGASRRIERATGLVLAGRRPGSRQDQGDDQTVVACAKLLRGNGGGSGSRHQK